MKTKIIIFTIISLLIAGLGFSTYTYSNKVKELNTELSVATNNIKAYEYENDSLSKENLEFLYTVDQLNYSCDSLVQKLNQARKQINIKDKNIRELEYIASQNRKIDSVYVHDTLFRENAVLDTLIQDKWASMRLHLEYPNKIITDYSFRNESIIISSAEKQTINPPKKCWIGRLFQKKHTVVKVDVIQENPYCENKEQKYIKIIE